MTEPATAARGGTRPWLDTPRRFGLFCVLVYVALAWTARFDMRLGAQIRSLVYPLDTFSMYAGLPGRDSSMLLVRDRSGAVHRITSFRAFDCETPLADAAARCAHTRGIPYLHEDFLRYIEAHRGPGDEPVELITRTWEVRAGTAPQPSGDCVVARCRVAR